MEEGCRLKFDYAKVYWNSKLQYEHKRLVGLFKPSDIICDVFCGVGPFSLPAAKKGCTVFSNDLNPDSIHWLTQNISTNRIRPNRITVYNLDGREFIQRAVKELDKLNEGRFDHFIMNLPAIAYQFLDVFSELQEEGLIGASAKIHCYTFCKDDADPVDVKSFDILAVP